VNSCVPIALYIYTNLTKNGDVRRFSCIVCPSNYDFSLPFCYLQTFYYNLFPLHFVVNVYFSHSKYIEIYLLYNCYKNAFFFIFSIIAKTFLTVSLFILWHTTSNPDILCVITGSLSPFSKVAFSNIFFCPPTVYVTHPHCTVALSKRVFGKHLWVSVIKSFLNNFRYMWMLFFSSNPAHGEVYSLQDYVIYFVSDFIELSPIIMNSWQNNWVLLSRNSCRSWSKCIPSFSTFTRNRVDILLSCKNLMKWIFSCSWSTVIWE
jgi:hypothetical protein